MQVRVQLLIERMWRTFERRRLACMLDRMAGDRGPGSFRSPEFLETEAELAWVCARLAEIEYRMGHREPAETARCRAEQIHTALGRFLEHAEIGSAETARLQAKLKDVGDSLSRMPDRYVAA